MLDFVLVDEPFKSGRRWKPTRMQMSGRAYESMRGIDPREIYSSKPVNILSKVHMDDWKNIKEPELAPSLTIHTPTGSIELYVEGDTVVSEVVYGWPDLWIPLSTLLSLYLKG